MEAMVQAETAYTIEEEKNCIRVSFAKGTVVSLEIIMEAVSDQHNRFDMTRYAEIWDFRGCQPHADLNYKTIVALVNGIDTNPTLHWGQAVAMLVDTELQYGFCRMFQILASDLQPKVGIFNDPKEAQLWIKEQ